MSITSLIRPFFERRYRQLEHSGRNADDIQRQLLSKLIARAQNTEWGRTHQYQNITSYEEFARKVPVNTYEDLKGFIDRMRHGESDVLWPGRVKWYAKSSGTTNDKSKFIPVSAAGLQDTH